MNAPLVTSDTVVTDEQFWQSVLLYHNRPHLINRKLLGVLQVLFVKVDFNNDNIKTLSELFTRSAMLYEVRKLKEVSKKYITIEFLKNILTPYDKEVDFEGAVAEDLLEPNGDDTFISVRILLPRQGLDTCLEVVIFDLKFKTCFFYGVAEYDKKTLVPSFPYNVQLTSGYLTVCIQNFEDAETASAEWLSDHLFLKLMKWMNIKANMKVPPSLSLISLEEYTNNYHFLKQKYGKKIIAAWPEKTDPVKFVYEDIAIACYLISLWKITHPNVKPSFVDLGCGNGLLVYILNQEGYSGEGLDIRKRKIWDWYSDTRLRIETIVPSENYVFPKVDWIIGNHSDELTPWIPIITARSSYNCNFFLLPCCAYQLNGDKYIRKNTSISTYVDYLQYIKSECTTYGFKIATDKLRIPSTKRTCIVSLGRTYEEKEFDVYTGYVKKAVDKQLIFKNVQIRSSIDNVRNCTQLNRDFVSMTVKKIVSILLNTKDVDEKKHGGWWNKGKSILLPDLALNLGKDTLKNLKNECGGLQTLLKNHRYIFEVGQGFVKVRLPATVIATCSRYKSKPCWFYKNHPDGCLHDNDVCAYLH